MWQGNRRRFLRATATGLAGAGLGFGAVRASAQIPGERPRQDGGVTVLNPLGRVPISFIIDDSTCLVNLNRFAIPQFAAAWNYERYHHDWRNMPDEIPDDFVRKFAAWCGRQGVKGKYSVVPYPACVGRLDRVLPGWTRKELDASIELVRTLMLPHWDIHPEMVTHTWAIDTKTGHPYPERSPRYQENWGWSEGKSVDELTDYMTYGLKILKNVGLPCEGITTPGGFGTRVLPELAQATLQSCRDVFSAEIPHYFRHIYASGDRSVAPRVEYASGLDGPDPKCVVSIIGATGDWTGGWDASRPGEVDRYITADLSEGRMVEVIERGEPAIMVSHWTGIYFNGEELGFETFQEAVRRLHAKYDHLIWMKLSEIARYWAAKELTQLANSGDTLTFHAPFAAPNFTVQLAAGGQSVPKLTVAGTPQALENVSGPLQLKSGAWTRDNDKLIVCFDLPKGASQLVV
jgi:hypothetical protein